MRATSHERLGDGWTALQRDTALQRGWGDCYGHCLVATGRADVMLDPRMNPWDCAALMPILQEAGGRFTDWSGPRADGGDAVSTNGGCTRRCCSPCRNQEAEPGIRRIRAQGLGIGD